MAAVALAAAVVAVGVWAATDDASLDQPADAPATPRPTEAPSPPAGAPRAAGGRADVTVGLVAGSDTQEIVTGERADVIMVGLVADGLAPALVSLPRDLWVANPCTGSRTRLNAGLRGCGDERSGPQLLSQMVAQVVDTDVDHHLVLDFAGFTEVVDAAGGVPVCVERPTRQVDLGLELDPGCQTVDGRTALAWVRSRATEERIDGRWQRVEGVDDLTRTARQRELTVGLLARLGDLDDPGRLLDTGRALRTHATVDDDLGVDGALALVSQLGDSDEVVRVEPRVEPHTTDGGAQVLRLAESVADALRREHPELADRVW